LFQATLVYIIDKPNQFDLIIVNWFEHFFPLTQVLAKRFKLWNNSPAATSVRRTVQSSRMVSKWPEVATRRIAVKSWVPEKSSDEESLYAPPLGQVVDPSIPLCKVSLYAPPVWN